MAQCMQCLHMCCGVFPNRRNLWCCVADLEKAHGTHECLDKLLAHTVKCCPQAEVLWPMWAKEKWLGGDVRAAREVLRSTFERNSESEQIWLGEAEGVRGGKSSSLSPLTWRRASCESLESLCLSISKSELNHCFSELLSFALQELRRSLWASPLSTSMAS
ncbi:hypothetical protein F5148DRAFT_172109 [Russula earlei]|uniref:Uncharacterized protein n=1 Tax=Russula earlei TaxID=71964 RepID=A0ACC0TQJ1_9AGAM|nr:hypothetical protein F5148DRAFT_172109 [Russula earlei]